MAIESIVFTETPITSAEPKKRHTYTITSTPLTRAMINPGYTTDTRLDARIRQQQPDLFSWWDNLDKKQTQDKRLLRGYSEKDITTGKTNEYVLAIGNANGIHPLTIGGGKIFDLANLAWVNRIGTKSRGENPVMSINLGDIANLFDEKYDNKANRQNTKRKILKYISEVADLRFLHRGDSTGFINVWDSMRINGDNLEIRYSSTIADQFNKSTLPEIRDERIFKIKDDIAFVLYNILNQHYRIPKNRKDGTNNRLKVITLLEKLAGYIPTEDEAKLRPMQQRGAPIIRGLNALVIAGLLNYWKFVRPNGQEYTKAEIAKIEKNYNDFTAPDVLIEFEPSYRDDEFDRHTERFKQDGRIGNTQNNKPKRKGKK